MIKQHKCHWSCECWHILGIILWVAAVIALVYAWVATLQDSILGQRSSFWFANAMVLGILAAPLRLRGGNCGCEGCEGVVCKR